MVQPRRQGQKLPRTDEMVNMTLQELHARQGTTLHAIKKHISDKYSIPITNQRFILIKEYIRQLQSENMVKNITGKGLNGHIRLITKTALMPKKVSRKKMNISIPKTPIKRIRKLPKTPGAPFADSGTIAQAIGNLGNGGETRGTPRTSLPKNTTRKKRLAGPTRRIQDGHVGTP